MHLRKTLSIRKVLTILFLTLAPYMMLVGQGFSAVKQSVDYPQLSEVLTFEVDASYNRHILNSKSRKLSIDLPFFGKDNLQLDLQEIILHADGFTVIERSAKGDIIHPYQRGKYYRGTAKGHDDSHIIMAIHGEEMSGILEINGSVYNLGRLKSKSTHILYNTSSLDEDLSLSCSTLPQYDKKVKKQTMTKSTTCANAIDVYFECDYQMYLSFNSNTTSVTNYVNTMFAQISTLYSNENVPVQISEIVVWSTNDGYPSGTSALTNFASANNNSGFNGDVAHLLTNDSGSNGGVAYVDQLCGAFPYAYSDIVNSSQGYPTYSWDVQVVTHEMGHTLGSSHTHDCVWGPNNDQQIDDCGNIVLGGGSCYNPSTPIVPSGGGTIMSYCHLNAVGINFSNGFGIEPGNLIRTNHSGCKCDNSTCDTATEITTDGTYYAKPDSGNGGHSNSTQHADWFKFIPSTNGSIDFYSCNQGVDTRVWLYNGSCNSLTFQEMSDDDCISAGTSNYASEILSANVIAGTTYYIEWDNRWSTAGFNWEFAFTSSGGTSGTVDITCPSDVVSTNNCNPSDYDVSVTGVATSGDPSAAITFDDTMTTATCGIIIDRLWTVTDSNGNTNICNQYIDLSDDVAPIATCPSNIVLTSGNDCQAYVTWSNPVVTEMCTSVTTSSNYTTGNYMAVGLYSVVYTFLDDCSNSSTCSFNIEILDGCNNVPLDPCDDMHLNLTGDIVQDTYSAEMTLHANGMIQNGVTEFKAGQDLELEPGFEIMLGATLSAMIEDCNN